MKKNEKYHPVNNQEDEDGYILFPDQPIEYGNEKKKQPVNAGNSISYTPPDNVKQPFSRLNHSQSPILKRRTKK
ncbi:MAG: hypothetical protein JWM28_840 [Chitinophagaceae bacterium]|nr:hypothetical protein [Chitinophagaceae bacterium]